MIRTTTIITAALAVAAMLPAAPASAQRARVFVASYGSDSNPCTFGSPCKTFQHAHDSVAAHGEITAIDSAGFGPVTINKSVTITSPAGVEAGIAPPAPFSAAITINAGPSDLISLSGLTLDGGFVSNTTGIQFNSGKNLYIRDSAIRNFGLDGIDFLSGGGGSGGGNLSISNTVVSDNGDTGIAVYPSGAVGSTSYEEWVTLNRVEMKNNYVYGFFVWGSNSTGTIAATVSESSVSGSTFGYYALTDAGHSAVQLSTFHSVATANETGLRAEGAGATITAANSMSTGNGDHAWEAVNSGVVQSYGDNYFVGNPTDSGSPTPVSRQ
jgi:hypothetical protein